MNIVQIPVENPFVEWLCTLFDVPREYDRVQHLPVDQYDVYQAHWQNNWQFLGISLLVFGVFTYFAIAGYMAYRRDKIREANDIAEYGESLEVGTPRWLLSFALFALLIAIGALVSVFDAIRNILIVAVWPALG